jgi:multimeric flavodoxin WrbA
MDQIYKSVLESEFISFSFPLYFSSIPGPLKTVIDRFQPFWELSRQGLYPTKGQSGVAFVTAGSEYKEMFTPSQTILRHLMNSINGSFDKEKSIFCAGLDTEEGMANYQKVLLQIITNY